MDSKFVSSIFRVIVITTRLPTTFIETGTLILSRPGLANLMHRRTTQVVKDSPEGRTFVYLFYIESVGGIEFTITPSFLNSKLR